MYEIHIHTCTLCVCVCVMYAHTYGMYVCIRCVCVCIGWGYTVYVRKYVWRGGTEGVCFSLDEVITYYIEKRKKTDTQRVT